MATTIKQENDYDCVILGTGIQQCIAANHLAKSGKKVIQIDINSTCGHELRTLRYTEISSIHKKELIDLDSQFNIDLTPKFLLAKGPMKDLLLLHEVEELLSFVHIQGFFIYKDKKMHPIPCDGKSGFMTGLISFMQKPRLGRFFYAISQYADAKDKYFKKGIKPEEHELLLKKKFGFKNTMLKEFERYSLSKNSIEFIGHTVALSLKDDYLMRDPIETFDKMYFYMKSLEVHENTFSPFIYPLNGLYELSQAFSKGAGTHGCIHMLNTRILFIQDKSGIIEGESTSLVDLKNHNFAIKTKDNVNNVEKILYTNKIISEPSYLHSKTKKISEIITCVCIVKGEVEIIHKKYKMSSAHTIFLANEFKRKNDIFLAVLGKRESVCPEGYKICILSTIKETDDPEKEIGPVLKILNNVIEMKLCIKELREGNFEDENLFICKNADQTMHFETLYEDIVSVVKKFQ